MQPTTTPIAPGLLTISVVIAYDENGNHDVDPAEGVSGISVRAVEVGTNRVIAQAFTDSQGYAQLQVVTGSSAMTLAEARVACLISARSGMCRAAEAVATRPVTHFCSNRATSRA
ncbi:MAG: hypothetical protein K8L99_34545 [Anaerolineae bacterium]|nr:hypothetical protein [Anaerolineae bacterium]